MSNRRKISLAKLAEQLTGVRPGTARAEPARPGRPAFPRIPAERFEELLDQAEQDAITDAGQLRLRAMLPDTYLAAEREAMLAYATGPVPFTLHYQGRPQ